MASECVVIGNFTMDDIPEGLAGTQKIKLTYKIDLNGILKVTAISKSDTGNVV